MSPNDLAYNAEDQLLAYWHCANGLKLSKHGAQMTLNADVEVNSSILAKLARLAGQAVFMSLSTQTDHLGQKSTILYQEKPVH